MPLTSDEIRHVASAAAKEAVQELLVALGVDASDPKALIEMQKDFAHVRAWRESVETVKKRSLIAAVTIITGGILGAIWMAIKGSP